MTVYVPLCGFTHIQRGEGDRAGDASRARVQGAVGAKIGPKNIAGGGDADAAGGIQVHKGDVPCPVDQDEGTHPE